MNSSKKAWYVVAAVVVIAIVWAIWRNSATGPAAVNGTGDSTNSQGQSQGQTLEQNKPNPNPTQANETFWLGTLKASDNAKKGNLLLVTDKNTVYISTSRDFSDLVGKKVKVTYQGTLDSFQLGDITAQ